MRSSPDQSDPITSQPAWSPFERIQRLDAWMRALVLEPRLGALIGGGAGLLVGAAIVWTMRGHQMLTQAHQLLTAGTVLVLIWVCIGVVSGLTVLSPERIEPGEQHNEGV